MSTQEQPNPESEGDSKSADEGYITVPKKYYCNICKIPFMNTLALKGHFAGLMHKKRKIRLQANSSPMLNEEPTTVKAPLMENIRSLRDFMKDPDREEPLIGLEYVLETRLNGRRTPYYQCQLCQCNMEMVPMVTHLIGQKHRKLYLVKHYPEKLKCKRNNIKDVIFLRRIARELEKTEGLKMYKREEFVRPSIPTTSPASAMRKIKFSRGYKPENDPVQKEKALEYMENFEITSDKEAALVLSIAQSLSEDLKSFCEKQANLNYIKRLPSLLSPGEKIEKQHYPVKPFKNHKDHPGDTWDCDTGVTNGLVQLHSLLQVPSTSHSDNNSYDQLKRKASLDGPSSKDLATVSALKSSFPFHSGIKEWMKQFNQSASACLQSAPAKKESHHSRSTHRSYTRGGQTSSSPPPPSSLPEAEVFTPAIKRARTSINAPAPNTVNAQPRLRQEEPRDRSARRDRSAQPRLRQEEPRDRSAHRDRPAQPRLRQEEPRDLSSQPCRRPTQPHLRQEPRERPAKLHGRSTQPHLQQKEPRGRPTQPRGRPTQPHEWQEEPRDRSAQPRERQEELCERPTQPRERPVARKIWEPLSYTMQGSQENGNIDRRIKTSDTMESYSNTHLPLISYPLPKSYQARNPSQRKSSWYHDEPENINQMPMPSFSSESSGPGWPQQLDYQQSNVDNNLGSYSSFSDGSSHRDHQLLNTQLNDVVNASSSDLPTNIMSQFEGQDADTLTIMLQQLQPHYPSLQKINIHALAQALTKKN